MTELHPPDAPVNGGLLIGAPPPDIPNLTTKRQRRPSVRLGDIGDHQPSPLSYEPSKRSTTNRLWSSDSKFHHNNHYSPSTTTTGTAGGTSSNQETLEIEEKNFKRAKRGGTKRVRSNWYKGLDDESEPKQSPNHFQENVVKEEEEEEEEEDGLFLRKPVIRADHSGVVELDTDLKDWNCRTSVDGNNGGSGDRERELEDGVRMWLNGLGLGRYEPVFEVHEVDEEVLPLLTLDDLKDMGINAVGSRRKLYCAIQKLGKGFS